MTAAAKATARRWLPRGEVPVNRPRVFCLPHAGAGAAGFADWQRVAGPYLAVCPVQPPGRAERFREAPHTAVRALVDELIAEIGDQFTGPYALFGHSMGGLVVFELARRLRAIGADQPVHLFVSGRAAPQLPDTRKALRDLPVEQLAEELSALGGMPETLLRSPQLMELVLPLLRADLRLNEEYSYYDEPPLDIPLTALGGYGDPRASEQEMFGWHTQTSRRFSLHLFHGGHFYLTPHARQVLDVIRREVTP